MGDRRRNVYFTIKSFFTSLEDPAESRYSFVDNHKTTGTCQP